jgi:quinol-cytochrome oxidoreductase complex cytochrome b subunit
MADGNGRVALRERVKDATQKLWNSQVTESILRPGSPFKADYSDSPRNRSYVVMNNVLYHLHPVKVKRHGVRLSYTLCLGGLSFFLFILLTITGIFLMFYYTPTAEIAYADMERLSTDVAFGSLVRNIHRWGAHLMVLSVFLHMSRVFYHGAYKPPREFNWVVGVVLLFLTLFLSFSGYLLPWDQLALWAVTVGTNMAGFSPIIGDQVKFALLAGVEVTGATLLRFYVLHVLAFPFILVVFLAVHFWRVRKDGGISGPL